MIYRTRKLAELGDRSRDVTVEMLLDYFDFMAAGDEEIARSANPRFALESVLIRLATLPKTLPVGELIDRLERLEGKSSEPQSPPLLRSESRPCRHHQPLIDRQPRRLRAEWISEGDSASCGRLSLPSSVKRKNFWRRI